MQLQRFGSYDAYLRRAAVGLNAQLATLTQFGFDSAGFVLIANGAGFGELEQFMAQYFRDCTQLIVAEIERRSPHRQAYFAQAS